MSDGHSRREPRYALNVEVHVHDGSQSRVTETRELSRSGLFAFLDPAPRVGAELSIQLHPADDVPITLAARACYRLAGIGVGVELLGLPEEMARYQGFVRRLALSQEAWKLIGQHVGEQAEPPLGGVERTLIGVGRNLLAVRMIFERRPPVSLEQAFQQHPAPPLAAELAVLVGVSAEPVELKLHSRDRLRLVWLGVAHQGPTYVALVPPQSEGRNKWLVYALSGQEQMVIKTGDRAQFPELSRADLRAIERDGALAAQAAPPKLFNVAEPPRLPKTPTGELPAFPREHLPTPTLRGWTPYSEGLQQELLPLFDQLDAETRWYRVGNGERPVRLLRDLAFLVRKQGSDQSPQPGTLVHDGRRLCVIFGLRSEDQKIMRPLDESDEIRLPTLDG